MAAQDGSDSVRSFLYRTSGGFSALRSSDDVGASASANISASATTTKATKIKTSKKLKKSKKLKHGGGSSGGGGGEMVAGGVEGGDGRADQIARLVSLESDLIGVLDDVYSLNSIMRMQDVFGRAIADVRAAIAYIQANRCTRCNMLPLPPHPPPPIGVDRADSARVDNAAISRAEKDSEEAYRKDTAAELSMLETILHIPHPPQRGQTPTLGGDASAAPPGSLKLGGTIHIMDNVDTGAVSVFLGGVLRDAGIYAAQQ